MIRFQILLAVLKICMQLILPMCPMNWPNIGGRFLREKSHRPVNLNVGMPTGGADNVNVQDQHYARGDLFGKMLRGYQ